MSVKALFDLQPTWDASDTAERTAQSVGAKIKHLALVLFALIFLSESAFAAFTGSGSGTEGDPYQITTAAQLDEVKDYLDGNFTLMNDIDLSGANWEPIGSFDTSLPSNGAFTGTFDGNNHEITGLTIDGSDLPERNSVDKDQYVGLFGYTWGASIKNLGLKVVSVSGDQNVGGLVGNMLGTTITNAYVYGGTVTGNTNTGGLVGRMSDNPANTITNAYVHLSEVVGNTSDVGGLVGRIVSDKNSDHNTITSSYAVASVTGTNTSKGGFAGGIEDAATTIVTNSYWDTDVSGITAGVKGTPKTTAQMKDKDTFTAWDLTNTWSIDEANASDPYISYPYFTANAQDPAPGRENVEKVTSITDVTLNGKSALTGDDAIDTLNDSVEVTVAYTIKNQFGGVMEGEIAKLYFNEIQADGIVIVPQGTANGTYDIKVESITDSTKTAIAQIEVKNSTDKSELQAKVDAIDDLEEVAYTTGTWSILQEDLVEIQAVLNDANATQEEVNTALESLTTTIESLESIFAGGDGSKGNPYQIETAFQLNHVRYLLDKNYIVSNDINLTTDLELGGQFHDDGKGWKPIGDSTDGFEGVFDGNDKQISGLTISRADEDNVGLFGVTAGATIKDLSIEVISVEGKVNVGGLIGEDDDSSVLENCHVVGTGNVKGVDTVGGLIGKCGYSTLGNLSATVDVNSTGGSVGGLIGKNIYSMDLNSSHATGNVVNTSTSDSTGGLIGYAGGQIEITNSYATGSVTSQGDEVGGLIGSADLEWNVQITNSYATGVVTGKGYVGGLIGSTSTSTSDYNIEVTNSYATGNVDGDSYVGGLIGDASDTVVTNSHAAGDVKALLVDDGEPDGIAGGLIGSAYKSSVAGSYAAGNVSATYFTGGLFGFGQHVAISKSYATGDINTTHVEGAGVGGLMGYISGTSSIDTSYAAGSVWGADHTVTHGGIVGTISGSATLNITKSYWDTQTTGQTLDTNADYSSGSGTRDATGKTTAEMKQQTTFSDWDFTDDWGIKEVGQIDEISYPYLRSNIQDPEPGLQRIFAGGDGSETAPYQIETPFQLDQVRNFLDKHFILNNDIDLGVAPYNLDAGWKPIGDYASGEFAGLFDGNNKKITGLTISRPTEDRVGLFGAVDGAEVKNLGLEITTLLGQSQVGALAGNAENIIVSNVYTTGDVEGTGFNVGGLMGAAGYSTITNVSTSGNTSSSGQYGGVGGLVGKAYDVNVTDSNVTGSVSGETYVGGLFGSALYETGSVEVKGSYASGDVNSTGEYAGGLIGYISSWANDSDPYKFIVTDSYATGVVTGSSDSVGGLVGSAKNTTEIRRSSARGSVNGKNFVGGLIGSAEYDITVSDSYATGAVVGTKDFVGGLIGNIPFYEQWSAPWGTIINSYATGTVSGVDHVGGLIGDANLVDVNDSYSVGKVTGSGTYIGGFIGSVDLDIVIVTNSFWDIETSGQTQSAGGEGLVGTNKLEMKQAAIFSDANWSFESEGDWNIMSLDSSEYISYPYLRNNIQDPAPGLEKPVLYTVTFQGEEYDSSTLIDGTTFQTPTEPARDGYSFGGWYADEQYSDTFDFEAPITSNTTLYAQWIKNPPSFSTDLVSFTIDEDSGAHSYELNATDVEGSDLNITITSSDVTKLAVSTSWDMKEWQNQASYSEALDFNLTTIEDAFGDVDITVTISDGIVETSQTFSIAIAAVNDAPVLSPISSQFIYKGINPFSIVLGYKDVDNTIDELEFSATFTNSDLIKNITFNENNMTISIHDTLSGTSDINVTLSDGEYSVSRNFSFTVLALQEDDDIKENGVVEVDENETITVSFDDNKTVTAQTKPDSNNTVSHKIDLADGKTVTASSDLNGTEVSITQDGVQTKYEDTTKDIIAEAKASVTGKASHILDINNTKVEATSEFVGAKTVIKKDADGSVVIETSVDVDDNTSISVVAKEDGSATHTVKKGDLESKASAKVKGAKTLIDESGNVNTSVDTQKQDVASGKRFEAVAITGTDGKTQTKFRLVDTTTNAEENPEPTLIESEKFPEGSEVEIKESDTNTSIIHIQTTTPVLTQPTVFTIQ